MAQFTGEDLLQKLLAMTPEERSLPLFSRAEDVGRWRATVHIPIYNVHVMEIGTGRNDADADDDDEDEDKGGKVVKGIVLT